MSKCLVIYTPKSKIILQEEEQAPKSKLKGVFDFVHYIRYRDSLPGEYTLKAKSLKELKKQFFAQYAIIKAAGGVVFNDKGELLMIYRRGHWDLPKGKLEKNESKKDCALREVEEETGVTGLSLVEPLSLYYNGKKTTYHTYRYKRKPTIKPSYWYIMKAPNQKLVPQTEEDIEKAIWVNLNDVKPFYDQMYPAIQDIVTSVREMKLHHQFCGA